MTEKMPMMIFDDCNDNYDGIILMIMMTKNDQITYIFCVRSSLILVKL